MPRRSGSDVDEGVIDEGLAMVRRLWDAGLAHRDIKPANLMVRDGHLLLIDVFFVQVKPSPWRQAVDLGNMMLVLAVRSDVDLVYRRASVLHRRRDRGGVRRHPGIASPTQLRAFMKRDPRDLLGQFRARAPERRPIPISVGAPGRGPAGPVDALRVRDRGLRRHLRVPPGTEPGHRPCAEVQRERHGRPLRTGRSVGRSDPCVAALPSGWAFGGGDIESGEATFWLNSDRAGERAVVVSLTDGCDVSGAHEVPSDEADTRRFEDPSNLAPLVGVRSYVFPGGTTYRFAFAPGASTALVFDVDEAVSFVPRTDLVADLQEREGLALCGQERAVSSVNRSRSKPETASSPSIRSSGCRDETPRSRSRSR